MHACVDQSAQERPALRVVQVGGAAEADEDRRISSGSTVLEPLRDVLRDRLDCGGNKRACRVKQRFIAFRVAIS